jgi:nickel-dependent lactate racemase
VSDRTRPVPNRLLLGVLLEELSAAGIPPERVTVLVATGLHHPPSPQELVEILGREVLAACRVLGHDARDESAQVPVGEVAGRAVLMDRAYVEAPLRIVTGLIEPHLMAGYSGGRKGVSPGVLAAQSILDWHRPQLLAHPRAAAGVFGGNPVDEEAHGIARLAPPHFLLNVTIDRLRRVTGVFAGDWEEAWQAGVRHVARSVVVRTPSPVDVVVTSAGGYPLDATFYQAIKGIVTASAVVRPGGVVILAASLAEGVGSAEFAAIFRDHPTPQAFLEHISRTPQVRIDQWQAQVLAQVREKCEVWVSGDGLRPEVLRSLYVEPLPSVEEGIERARKFLGEDASLLYLPEGPYIAPVLATIHQEA